MPSKKVITIYKFYAHDLQVEAEEKETINWERFSASAKTVPSFIMQKLKFQDLLMHSLSLAF